MSMIFADGHIAYTGVWFMVLTTVVIVAAMICVTSVIHAYLTPENRR